MIYGLYQWEFHFCQIGFANFFIKVTNHFLALVDCKSPCLICFFFVYFLGAQAQCWTQSRHMVMTSVEYAVHSTSCKVNACYFQNLTHGIFSRTLEMWEFAVALCRLRRKPAGTRSTAGLAFNKRQSQLVVGTSLVSIPLD